MNQFPYHFPKVTKRLCCFSIISNPWDQTYLTCFNPLQLLFFLKIYIFLRFYLFLERGQGREGEKHQCVVASHVPPTGDLTWPATQANALTGNRTSDPLVHRLALNPLSHTIQGYNLYLWLFSPFFIDNTLL